MRGTHLGLHLQCLDVLHQAAVGARQGIVVPVMHIAQLPLQALNLRHTHTHTPTVTLVRGVWVHDTDWQRRCAFPPLLRLLLICFITLLTA